MMPYTQISNYGGNELPLTLYFDGPPSGGTETGDPGGGSANPRKAPKKTKKAAPKSKKKR